VAVGPFSIGPAFGVHLEHAEIHAQLNLLLAVSAIEFSNDDLARFVGPLFEEWRNVEIHGANMAANGWQVNGRLVLSVYFGENQGVNSIVNVAIHASQFPEQVRKDLLDSLRQRAVNHKFHYDSVKQTQKWLALHQAYSPSRNDADCTATYDRGFEAAVAGLNAGRIHLVGLGCGGGQKDTRLLELLKRQKMVASYTPCDVSTAMVLAARQTALSAVPEGNCFPLVCDLLRADDLVSVFAVRHPALITFFGMIPNFEPETILPKLGALIQNEDRLLFSANLAPGFDYDTGVGKVLPQYDNQATRDWLLTFLFDLGVELHDGMLNFTVEQVGRLKRIAAYFEFTHQRSLAVEDQKFDFRRGDRIRLFFSYRYTPVLVREVLTKHGLVVVDEWITKSEEEGVFLCRRSSG
jgi:uncharacterized SAM-dependent methyltransferase